MSLVDVTTNLATAILADPRCPAGLTFNFGLESLANEDSPPRIIWVPMPGPIEGPSKGGYQNAFEPRSVGVRKAAVDAHCWGAALPYATATTQQHYEAAELLLDLLVCALYNQLEGIAPATFEDPRKPDNIQLGWLISVTFSVEIPIPLPASPSVIATTGVIAIPGS